MLRNTVAVFAVVATLVLAVTAPLHATTVSEKSSSSSLNPTLALLCADDGKFSGVGELSYVVAALQNQTNASSAANLIECESALFGYLPGSQGRLFPTIVVTTGIGALNAAMCVDAVHRAFGSTLDTMLFIGTSGWSPFNGGLDANPTNPDSCNKLPASQGSTPHAIGSVAFTSTAALFACGKCMHTNDFEQVSECYRPSCELRSVEALFGKCTFTEDDSLAAQLRAFARNAISTGAFASKMPTALQQLSKTFWAAMGMQSLPTPLVPSIPERAIEWDMEQILASGPADYLCREYTANIFNKMATKNSPLLTSNDVTCVNAMEGVGFLRALEKRKRQMSSKSKSDKSTSLRVAIVRGMSNPDVFPLQPATWPAGLMPASAPQRWIQAVNYTSAANHSQLVTLGYRWAIQTTNEIVLMWLKTQ